MRSSSIESNNTTIYKRPILCNSHEQVFREMVMPILSTATGNSGQRVALCPFGEEKKTRTKILEKKQEQQRGGVRVEELQASAGLQENKLLNSD